MEKYTKYKESGIEWIGEIPEEWKIQNLKYFANIILGKMLTSKDKGGYYLKPYLRAANIDWLNVKVDDVKEMWFSEQELLKYRIEINDLLVSEGGEVGRTCIWKEELEECYIQNSVHKITVDKNSDPRYCLYQFLLNGSKGVFDYITNRISIAHLTVEKIKEVRFVTPTRTEQTAIANYLDSKTADLDHLISEKKQIVKLYQEEKTAIINQAVTKGINPNAKLKDSGIEWLGDIPEHWEVKKFKYYFDLITSKVDKELKKIGLENIESKSGKFKPTKTEFAGDGIHFMINDILFGKLRPYLAKVWLATFEGKAVGDFYSFRVQKEVTPTFAKLRILDDSFINVTNSSSYGSKMPRVSWEFIANLFIAFPPIKEQTEIVVHIEKESKRIDAKIKKAEKYIKLLTEYRTALISEVVTGKIKIG